MLLRIFGCGLPIGRFENGRSGHHRNLLRHRVRGSVFYFFSAKGTEPSEDYFLARPAISDGFAIGASLFRLQHFDGAFSSGLAGSVGRRRGWPLATSNGLACLMFALLLGVGCSCRFYLRSNVFNHAGIPGTALQSQLRDLYLARQSPSSPTSLRRFSVHLYAAAHRVLERVVGWRPVDRRGHPWFVATGIYTIAGGASARSDPTPILSRTLILLGRAPSDFNPLAAFFELNSVITGQLPADRKLFHQLHQFQMTGAGPRCTFLCRGPGSTDWGLSTLGGVIYP